MRILNVCLLAVLFSVVIYAQSTAKTATTATPVVAQDEGTISPSRAVPVGKAPGMQWKLVNDEPSEKVYAIVFHAGDEALSGLTDFAIAQGVKDAHFTGIGAVQSATLAWLDLAHKNYRKIGVGEQCEVLSLIGDVASFDGKPVVHMHAVLGHSDGTTVGGHVFELNVRPTLEVFMTVNTTALKKKADEVSGMKFIDPAE